MYPAIRRTALALAGTVALTSGLIAQTSPRTAGEPSPLEPAPGNHPAPRASAGPGAIRFVHTGADAGPVSFVVDDASLGDFFFRDAGDVSAPIAAGNVNVKVKQAVGPADITRVEKEVRIAADTISVQLLMGRLSDNSLGLVELKTPVTLIPPPGTSLVRMVHASPDVGPVDVQVELQDGSIQRYDNISYRSATEFVALNDGFIELRVYPAGGSTPMLTVAGYLPADRILTAIATGMASDQSLGINALFEDLGLQQPMVLLPVELAAVFRADAGGRPDTELIFSPNPARERASVSLRLDGPEEISVTIVDPLGRPAARIPLGFRPEGEVTVPVDLGSLPAGLYRAIVTGSSGEMLGASSIAVVR